MLPVNQWGVYPPLIEETEPAAYKGGGLLLTL